MPISVISRVSLAGVLLALTVSAARAAEPVAEFLDALQKKGYGEAGVDYLEMLKAQGKLTPEMDKKYKLEMSTCIRLSVKEAFNKSEKADRETKWKALLEEYKKENPNENVEEVNNAAFEQAMQMLAEAKNNKDTEAAAKQYTDARKAFRDSLAGFTKTSELAKDKFLKLKAAGAKNKTAVAAIEEAALDWQDARMKVALIDYFISQTFTELKAKARIEALKACAKQLDDIYQENRNNPTPISVYAHLWTGKCEDEMGHDGVALDIYDEVSGFKPTSADEKKETGLEPLLAQAANFRMQIKLRKEGPEAYMTEADEWLKQWDAAPDTPLKKAYRKTDGYQAISLQVVKRQIELAEKANGSEKSKLLDAARKRLRDMVKVKSESQAEAMHLTKSLKSSGAGPAASGDPAALAAEVKTFDEAATLGEEADKNETWAEAEAYYTRALELTEKVKDKQKITTIRNSLERVGFAIAIQLYQASKMPEAFEKASHVAQKSGEESVIAPKASAMCVQILLAQYAASQDKDEKEAILTRMTRVAEYTLKKWPDRPEADDVRISLGRSELVRGNLDAALKAFEEVNPRSERRAMAMQLAGQLHWNKYVHEKSKKPEGERDLKMMEENRGTAEEQLTASLDGQKKALPKGEEWPSQLIDTQLLLGKVLFDKGQFREAAELLQPLIDEFKLHKPAAVDNKTVQPAFILAVRAYNGAGDFTKGGAAAQALIELVETDSPEVNTIGVDFVRILADEYKVLEISLIDAKTKGDPGAKEKIEAKMDALKSILTNLLEKLTAKQNHSLIGLIIMGDTAARIGNTKIAEDLYKRALAQAETEKANPPAGGTAESALKAIDRIRAEVVGLMQQKGQFSEGVVEIDKLIAEHPKALPPKMVKGRLLQAWAAKDATKFKEAQAQWVEIRNMLGRMRGNKPSEFFEANYFVALCLVTEYEQSKEKEKDKVKLTQARQTLNALMMKSPSLSGPEMVARYNQLLDKVTKILGDEPAPANGKTPKTAAATK